MPSLLAPFFPGCIVIPMLARLFVRQHRLSARFWIIANSLGSPYTVYTPAIVHTRVVSVRLISDPGLADYHDARFHRLRRYRLHWLRHMHSQCIAFIGTTYSPASVSAASAPSYAFTMHRFHRHLIRFLRIFSSLHSLVFTTLCSGSFASIGSSSTGSLPTWFVTSFVLRLPRFCICSPHCLTSSPVLILHLLLSHRHK